MIWLLWGFAILLWASLAQAQDITTGLVGYWKMNETSGLVAADSSGLGHNGNLLPAGTPPTFVAGQVANALQLDGTEDRVSVPFHADFNLTTQLTIAAWVRRTAASTIDTLLFKTDGATFWDWGVSLNTLSRMQFYSDSGGHTGVNASTVSAAINTWTHIAVTRNGTAIAYWVAADNAGTATMAAGSFQVRSFPVLIGTDGLAGSYFGGQLDEVRIYNVAKTEVEIEQMMAFVEPGAPSARRRITISAGPRGLRHWLATVGKALCGGCRYAR